MHRVSSTENHSWSWLHCLLWVTRSGEPKEHIERESLKVKTQSSTPQMTLLDKAI